MGRCDLVHCDMGRCDVSVDTLTPPPPSEAHAHAVSHLAQQVAGVWGEAGVGFLSLVDLLVRPLPLPPQTNSYDVTIRSQHGDVTSALARLLTA